MTLMPGESTYVTIPIPLPPEIAEQIRKGHIKMTVSDISAQVYGKYQYCTKAKDGMWYADDDFTRGDGFGKPKRGALPNPQQDTPELTERARKIHEDSAKRLTESILPSARSKPWWRFW